MAKRAKRQWMRTSERRRQLLDCAVAVFARTSLGRGTHAGVAEVAKVSVATVFSHFATRELLVEAVVQDTDRFFSEMIGGVLRNGGPRETLLELGRAFANSAETHPDYARVWLDWSTSVESPLWTSWLRFQQRALRAIRATVRRGILDGTVDPRVDADTAARIFNGSSHIVTLMKFAGHRPKELDRFLVQLVESALRMPLDKAHRL